MSHAGRRSRSQLLLIFGLVGIGFLLRLLFLNEEGLWYDEALTALSLRLPFGEMIRERLAAGHSPLYFTMLYPIARVFGTGEIVMRLPSVCASTLSIYVFYLIAEKLLGEVEPAFIATLYYAMGALNVYFAQEARMYAFSVLFALMSFYFLLKALEGVGWREWVPFGLSTLVFVYLSASTIPILFAQLVFVLIKRKRIVPFFISLAAVVALYLPMGIFYLRMGRLGFIEWLPPIRTRTYLELFYGFGFRPIPLPNAEGMYHFYLRAVEVLSLLVVFGSIAGGVWYGLTKRDLHTDTGSTGNTEAFLMSVIWLFLPLLLLSAYSFLKQPMLGPKRYIIALSPAYYLLLGHGVYSMRRHVFRRIAAIVLLLLFSATLFQYYQTTTREDWRNAVGHLNERYEAGEILFGDLSTQVMYRYYGSDESMIIMDIRYLVDTGFGRGWVLLREKDFDRFDPYLETMERYYRINEVGPFNGLKMIRFRARQ
jgi:4-amino-4-deoxy-L-arabinose transferase-like glycosyltransferase